MVDSVNSRCPGPVAAKQAQIFSPPSTSLTVAMRCWFFFKCAAVHYDQKPPLWSGLSKGHFSRSKPKLFFLERTCFLPITLLNRAFFFSLSLIALSWTLKFNMTREACKVWDVAFSFICSFSEYCTAWSWGELSGTSTPGKFNNCLECFPYVNNLSYGRLLCHSKLFRNGLLTLKLLGSNSCFPMIIVHVFPPWHCVNTHPNAPDKQTVKTSAYIEVLTVAVYQYNSRITS